MEDFPFQFRLFKPLRLDIIFEIAIFVPSKFFQFICYLSSKTNKLQKIKTLFFDK